MIVSNLDRKVAKMEGPWIIKRSEITVELGDILLK